MTVDMDWRIRAACRGEDPNLFFPERPGLRLGSDMYAAARKVCRGCSVTRQCFFSVIDLPQGADDTGMFAGLTPEQRRQIRRCRTGVCEHGSHRRPE